MPNKHRQRPKHMANAKKHVANGLNIWPMAFLNIARGNAPGLKKMFSRRFREFGNGVLTTNSFLLPFSPEYRDEGEKILSIEAIWHAQTFPSAQRATQPPIRSGQWSQTTTDFYQPADRLKIQQGESLRSCTSPSLSPNQILTSKQERFNFVFECIRGNAHGMGDGF